MSVFEFCLRTGRWTKQSFETSSVLECTVQQ